MVFMAINIIYCLDTDRIKDIMWNKSSVLLDQIEFRNRLNQFEFFIKV